MAALPGLAAIGAAVLALRAGRTRATALALVATAGLVAWQNVAAAGIDGPSAWREPFRRSALEYAGDVAHVERLGPAGFVQEYPRLISELIAPPLTAEPATFPPLTLHGATHPPGGALVLWAGLRLWDTRLERVSMDRPPRERLPEPVVARASVLAIGLTALAVLATGALAWLGHGPRAAAVAAALHVVTPSLVWFGATSMDGVFLLAAAAAQVPFEGALPGVGRPGLARAGRLGVVLGLAAAVASTLTYAVVVIALLFALRLACLLAVDRGAAARGAVACGVGGVTWLAIHLLLLVTVGFDLVANVSASLAAARVLVGSGTEDWARYLDITVANVVGFVIGCGPPTIALVACAAARGGLMFVRRRARSADAAAVAWCLTVAIAAASTLFTLELERIWLFLIPPALAIAAGELGRALRGWPGLAWATSAVALLLLAQTLALEARLYTWW